MAEVLVYTDFVEALSKVESPRTRQRIEQMLRTIELMPGVGSALMPAEVRRRYGKGALRALAGSHQIIYEYDESADVVSVYDLLYSPTIR